MTTMLIPKGYKPIAVRDEQMGVCTVSFNPEEKKFILVVRNKIAGPYTLAELKMLADNISDVVSMSGRYLYIEQYNVDGTINEG